MNTEINQDTLTFTVGTQFNVAFAYGDTTGLTDLEEQQFNNFMNQHPGTWILPDDDFVYELESCEITNLKSDCINIILNNS